MKSIKYILSLCVMLSVFSCKSQNTEVELELKECINEKVNKNIQEAYGKEPFDFYTFILKIEQELLSNKLLQNVDKGNYLSLFNKITQSENNIDYLKMYKRQNEIIDDFGFGFNSFAVNDNIFNQCPYKVSVESKEKEGKLIYSQGVLLNKLMAQGYSNEVLLKELINVTDDNDFKKDVYRAPVILLVMINLDTKYNPDLKKLKEQQKGKIFLNEN